MRSQHLSVVINASPQHVYDVVADPRNLPRWAAGLARSEVRQEEGALIADSPMGEVRVRFVDRNNFGVADHTVQLPDGALVVNPLRVLAHPNGAEIIFTLRQLEMSDEAFERDGRLVREDLDRLRSLVESGAL